MYIHVYIYMYIVWIHTTLTKNGGTAELEPCCMYIAIYYVQKNGGKVPQPKCPQLRHFVPGHLKYLYVYIYIYIYIPSVYIYIYISYIYTYIYIYYIYICIFMSVRLYDYTSLCARHSGWTQRGLNPRGGTG